MTESRDEENRESSNSTHRSLIVRLQGDDPIAWQEMVHLYSPLILHWCRTQGARDRDCEDILQDVFRTVIRNIERFRKDKPTATFRGWLRTVTRSRVIDFYRRKTDDPDPVGGTEANLRFAQIADSVKLDGDESDPSEPDEERQLFLRAIELIREDFKPDTWKAFWRTTVDGCSAQDVAEELGMRPGTVRVAKSRVLQRLRDRLGDCLE